MSCRSERSRRAAAALVAAGLAGLPGCSLITEPFATNEFSGDPYPIPVDLSSGGIRVATSEPASAPRTALIDILSPISILDTGPTGTPRATERSLLILGAATDLNPRVVGRARVSGSVFELHPCAPEPICEIGPECESPDGCSRFPVEVVLGADLFAGDALRLDLQCSSVSLFPDIAGDATARSRLCDAVFPEPFRGGGTLVFGGTEVPYVGRRVVVSTCAAPAPDPTLPRRLRGTDLLMVASTALGVTVLAESAYQRYQEGHPTTTPALADLPVGGVTIPAGHLAGHLGTLPALAMVGKGTERGACGDVYAHHLLTESDCTAATIDCPCTTGTQCGAPAIVELSSPVEVLIIADSEPLLVGLRTELHPDQAEVDGVLGTNVLARLQLDIDYPNNRLLGRCRATDCEVRPELPNTSYRARVNDCLLDPLRPPACTVP